MISYEDNIKGVKRCYRCGEPRPLMDLSIVVYGGDEISRYDVYTVPLTEQHVRGFACTDSCVRGLLDDVHYGGDVG